MTGVSRHNMTVVVVECTQAGVELSPSCALFRFGDPCLVFSSSDRFLTRLLNQGFETRSTIPPDAHTIISIIEDVAADARTLVGAN